LTCAALMEIDTEVKPEEKAEAEQMKDVVENRPGTIDQTNQQNP